MNRRRQQPNEDRAIARRSERWGFWALIIGGVSIVVSTVLAIWSVHSADTLAYESGAFDKPKPNLYINGEPLRYPLAVYIGAPFPSKNVTIVGVPLILRNDGKKTTKGVELIIRQPALIAIDNRFLQQQLDTFLPLAKPLERNVKQIGKYSYSSFLLPDLNPGQALRLDEPVRIANSQITDTFPVKSKDGMMFNVTTSLTYGLPITVSVAGEDLQAKDYSIELHGIRSENSDELKRAVFEELQREQANHEQALPFARRLFGFFYRVRQQFVLFYPKYEIVDVPGMGKLYQAVDTGYVAEGTYKSN